MKTCFALITLLFTTAAWASSIPRQPETCPSVAAITQSSFTVAQKSTDGSYGTLMLDNFGTQEMWGFVIAEVMANSPQDALAKAKDSLNSLTFLAGPSYYSSNNLWGCFYSVDAGYPVLALTPLPSQGRSVANGLGLEILNKL